MLLIAAVQFVNVLEFMMVAPLGPDFAVALDIPTSHLGWLVAAYTGAASLAGLGGGLFLDRYDRRKVLAASLVGLVVGTALGGLATSFELLLAARVIAGFFGGPATAVSLAIVADVVPIARRGQALGRVMSGFAVASVLGVPLVLEIARVGGWPMPFFFVAGLTVVIGAGVVALLPPLTSHIGQGSGLGYGELLVHPAVRMSYALAAAQMLAMFIVIPNFAVYLQYNLKIPRDEFGFLYFIGGLSAFLGLRLFGRLVDRYGAVRVAAVGCLGQGVGTLLWCLLPRAAWPEGGPELFLITFVPSYLYFPLFMLSSSCRNVAVNTLTSRVPLAHERARFQSLQSATNHAASALAGGISALILTETPEHALVGMPELAAVSIVILAGIPGIAWVVQRRVLAREGAGAHA